MRRVGAPSLFPTNVDRACRRRKAGRVPYFASACTFSALIAGCLAVMPRTWSALA